MQRRSIYHSRGLSIRLAASLSKGAFTLVILGLSSALPYVDASLSGLACMKRPRRFKVQLVDVRQSTHLPARGAAQWGVSYLDQVLEHRRVVSSQGCTLKGLQRWSGGVMRLVKG
jgi:hypothetical protein